MDADTAATLKKDLAALGWPSQSDHCPQCVRGDALVMRSVAIVAFGTNDGAPQDGWSLAHTFTL
ncbi:hypothetical protein RISK_006685 [Rhodopirellula islandica]|uniref:Uncharacterized protein n=1 Tax=Rhodopirellula islandica TaxID=595434 RepID=A0A0J1B3R5_RHOIS|nr:hypothetical protein RISK_006685 [Rhodopirellula islandica]